MNADVATPIREDAAVHAFAELALAVRRIGGRLADQRVLFLGAGQAALRIAAMVVDALTAQGVPPEQARAVCWLFDSRGLVVARRGDLAWSKRPYEHAVVDEFVDAIHTLKPTVLIGAAGLPFNRAAVQAMAQLNRHPIVLTLS